LATPNHNLIFKTGIKRVASWVEYLYFSGDQPERALIRMRSITTSSLPGWRMMKRFLRKAQTGAVVDKCIQTSSKAAAG
jgi:hypothetical protein